MAALRILRSLTLLLGFFAAGASVAEPASRLVTRPIDDGLTVALSGNTRPEATAANDRGRVADAMPLKQMQLLMQRPARSDAELARLIDALHDKASPNYHHWLTAKEFGRRFGPSAADVAAVTGWLTRHGFTVNGVQPSRVVIDFSGTAGECAKRSGPRSTASKPAAKCISPI